MHSIFSKIIFCVIIVLVSNSILALSTGEKVMQIKGIKEPHRFYVFSPTVNIKKLPSKMNVDSVEYEIVKLSEEGLYLWRELNLNKDGDFGNIYVKAAPDYSRVMQFAINQHLCNSNINDEVLAHSLEIRETNGITKLIRGNVCTLINGRMVITVSASKDANKIAEAIYEYQFGE